MNVSGLIKKLIKDSSRNGKPDEQPGGGGHVAMLHTGRCGSSVLGKMLNAHSAVSWPGEIFNKYMRLDKEKDGEALVRGTIDSSRKANPSKIYGFETKYLPQQHLSRRCINMSLDDYIQLLRTLSFSSFIVLDRRNYLRRAISVQVGTLTKKWHSSHSAATPEKIALDIHSFRTGDSVEPLLDLFRCMDENRRRLQDALANSKTLYLTYEDDILEDPNVAYRKTCEFLGVVAESPDIELQRTNPFPLRDLVVNLEDVKATLKDTEYSWMIDD